MENSVDPAQTLAYNDIAVESLLRKLKGAMHSTKECLGSHPCKDG